MTQDTKNKIITSVEFTVKDRLVIADPCYIDTNDGTLEENLATGILSRDGGVVLENCGGEWLADAILHDGRSWGVRVGRLVLTRLDHEAIGRLRPPERVGLNGVDSGQMGAFCASNVPLDYDALLAAYEGDHSRYILAFGGGAVSSTGYGDGVYPVEVLRDEDGRIFQVAIDFIGDEEDDEDQDDYESDEDDEENEGEA